MSAIEDIQTLRNITAAGVSANSQNIVATLVMASDSPETVAVSFVSFVAAVISWFWSRGMRGTLTRLMSDEYLLSYAVSIHLK